MGALEYIADGDKVFYVEFVDVFDIFEDNIERDLDPDWGNSEDLAPLTPESTAISKPLLKVF
jgi:hypothetical protein